MCEDIVSNCGVISTLQWEISKYPDICGETRVTTCQIWVTAARGHVAREMSSRRVSGKCSALNM